MERQSAEPLLHSELTDKIIAAFYAVYTMSWDTVFLRRYTRMPWLKN